MRRKYEVNENAKHMDHGGHRQTATKRNKIQKNSQLRDEARRRGVRERRAHGSQRTASDNNNEKQNAKAKKFRDEVTKSVMRIVGGTRIAAETRRRRRTRVAAKIKTRTTRGIGEKARKIQRR